MESNQIQNHNIKGRCGVKGQRPFIVSPRCGKCPINGTLSSGGGGQHQTLPPAVGRPLLAYPAPGGGRWAARRPGTPCAAAAAPQRRAHHAGPCAAALSGGAAVCCCVTPHTGPARWHHLRVKGPHRAGAPGCIPGSSSVHSGLLPAGWPSSGQPPHHSAAALCRSF